MNYSVVICSYNKLEYLKRVVGGILSIDGYDEKCKVRRIQ